MTINSLSDLVAGLSAGTRLLVAKAAQTNAEAAGIAQSFWDRGTQPAAGSIPGTLAGSTFTSASTGAVPLPTAAAQLYLANASGMVNTPGVLLIMDLLWANGGIAVATLTEQAITSPTFPSRDQNAAALGEGCELWLGDFTADTTNASAVTNTTARYTNGAGTTSRVATMPSWPQTARAGTIQKFNLAAGDTSIQSVQGLTLGTTYGAGTLSLMLMRRVAELQFGVASQQYQWNAIDLGLPKLIGNTACLVFIFVPVAATAASISQLWLTIADR